MYQAFFATATVLHAGTLTTAKKLAALSISHTALVARGRASSWQSLITTVKYDVALLLSHRD